jgi:O-antigen ligase
MLFPLPFHMSGLAYLFDLAQFADTGWKQAPVISSYAVVSGMFLFLYYLVVLFRRKTVIPRLYIIPICLFALSLFRSSCLVALISSYVWIFLFAAIILRRDFRPLVILVWLSLLSAQMVVALIAYIYRYHQLLTEDFGYRASGLFLTPNIFYPIALISFSLFFATWYQTLKNGNRRIALLLLGMALFSLLMVVLSFSRSVWIGAAGSIILISLRFRPFYRRIALIISFMLLISAFVVRTSGHIASQYCDRSVESRFQVWQEARHIWLKHPLLGAGPCSFYRLNLADNLFRDIGGLTEPKNLYLYCFLIFFLLRRLFTLAYLNR